jgi:soluble lytic murein transglycosylase-like protein
MTIDAVVEKIISAESNGDPNAKNKRSSAMGLGQFLDQTWLDLIRTHRPDL